MTHPATLTLTPAQLDALEIETLRQLVTELEAQNTTLRQLVTELEAQNTALRAELDAERAAIVAWLHVRGRTSPPTTALALADAIEAGG